MIQITPCELGGRLSVQPSKSYLHRAIICSALSGKKIRINHINQSEDVLATLRGVRGLGLCTYQIKPDAITIFPMEGGKPEASIDAKESGSTLRFLIPVALRIGAPVTFTGSQRLMERPLSPYDQLCRDKEFVFMHSRESVSLRGDLQPGEYILPGNLSSQFATGLLLALSQEGESKVILEGKVESLPYIQITLDVLSWFGVHTHLQGNVITIRGGYTKAPETIMIPGDWSAAANFAVAGALAGGITLQGLSMDDAQGDRAILEILQKMGAKYTMDNGEIIFEKAALRNRDVDVSQCPDLVPVLAVAMALSKGTGRIYNAGRLRIKESDRLTAITENLNAIGADVIEEQEGLLIQGLSQLRGGNGKAFNDHRIVMALAVASGFCRELICIDDETCVKKSAPDFWREFKQLGGSYVCRK